MKLNIYFVNWCQIESHDKNGNGLNIASDSESIKYLIDFRCGCIDLPEDCFCKTPSHE